MRSSRRARGELKERGWPYGDPVLIFNSDAVIASDPLSSGASINHKGKDGRHVIRQKIGPTEVNSNQLLAGLYQV